MLLVPYNHTIHSEHMATLLAHRHLNANLIEHIPQNGFIVTHSGIVVAAGFIRCVEGGFAMIDGFITNPGMSSDIRSRALDLLLYKIVKVSKYHGLVDVIANTIHPELITRAKRYGFKEIPQKMISLNSRGIQ